MNESSVRVALAAHLCKLSGHKALYAAASINDGVYPFAALASLITIPTGIQYPLLVESVLEGVTPLVEFSLQDYVWVKLFVVKALRSDDKDAEHPTVDERQQEVAAMVSQVILQLSEMQRTFVARELVGQP